MSDPLPELDALLAHAGFVRAMAVGVLGGDAEVDDVVQETWLVAMRSAPRRPGALRAWLGGVSRRLALRVRRGRGRRRRREEARARPEPVASVAEIAAREEARRRLVDAVLALEEPYRAAVLLRYMEDLPVSEVAARLGVPRETAKTRLRRGLERLRERLDAEHGGDRRAWAVGLAPLAGPAAPASAVALAVAAGVLVLGVGAAAVLGPALLRGTAGPAGPAPRAGGETADAGRLEAMPAASRQAAHGTGALLGRVVREGQPAGGVEVRLLAWDDEVLGSGISKATISQLGLLAGLRRMSVSPLATGRVAADGAYVFEGVAPGAYVVVADAPGWRAVAAAGVPCDGARVETGTLALEAATATIEGRFTRADGRPWPCQVAAYRVPPFSGMAARPWPEVGPVRTDDDGRFRLAGVPAGAWTLWALGPDRSVLWGAVVEAPAASPATVTVPEGGPVTAGAVVTEDGDEPIVGARVIAGFPFGRGGYFFRETATDGAGRFSCPEGVAGLWVEAEGFAPRAAKDLGRAGPDTVRLARAARVRGRVTSAEGEPLAGLSVQALPQRSRESLPLVAAVTDADGRYEVGPLASGDVRLRVAGRGFWAWASREPSGGYDPLVLTLAAGETRTLDLVPGKAAAVRGRVVDPAGRPVPGAVVWASDLDRRAAETRYFTRPVVATDAEGRFAFDTLPPDAEWEIVASAPGFGRGRVRTETSAGAPRTIDVSLPLPRRVAVLVVAEGDGRPVPGVRVALSRRVGGGWIGEGEGGVTGPDGRAVVERAPDGALGTRVDGGGIVPDPEVHALPGSESGLDVEDVVLTVRRGFAIEGVVLRPDGTPAAGALVTARREDGAGGMPAQRNATSGPDGRFALDGLPPGEHSIAASWRKDAETQTASLRAQAGAKGLRLVLAPPAPPPRRPGLEVRVVDAQGRPVPRACVHHYRRVMGQIWMDEGTEASDGTARFSLAEGETWIEAWVPADAPDGARGSGSRLVGPLPAGTTSLDVVLPPDRPVTGRVVGPDGRGVPGVVLTVVRAVREGWSDGPSTPYSRARTGAAGAFRLGGLGEGRWRVEMGVPPTLARPDPVEVEAGTDDLVVTLRAGVSPTITVLDAEGQPLAGAVVHATVPTDPGRPAPPTPPGASGTADAHGRVRFVSLDPTIPLRLEAGAAPTPRAAAGFLPFVDPRWTPADTVIRLAAALSVRGRVEDARGRPVPDARLTWMETENGGRGIEIAPDGTFSILFLPPGEVVLLAAVGDFPVPGRSLRIVVRAGDQDARVVVDPGVALEIQISDWPGPVAHEMPVARLVPEGATDAPSVRTQIVAPDGRVRFAGLDPRVSYELFVRAARGGLSLRRGGLRAGGEPLRVALVPGRTVTGRLRLPPGAEHASVEVIHPLAGPMAIGRVEADGEFVVEGVAEGAWRVSASAQVGDVGWIGQAPARAGDRVEIDLHPVTPPR